MGEKIGFLFFIIVLNYSFTTFGKQNEKDKYKLVLKTEIVDSIFEFGKWSVSGTLETHLKYLGKVKNTSGRTYKIVNSTLFWGISKRATNRILIFDKWNNYVGNYKIDTPDELPVKLINGELIFKNINNDCDRNTITKINLTKGLPRKFFRKCNSTNGDFFIFESE